MKRPYLFIISCVFLITVFTVLGSTASIQAPDTIRVLIADKVSEVKVSVKGEYTITALGSNEAFKSGKTFWNAHIMPAAEGIAFQKECFQQKAIHIRPKDEAVIYLDKRLYHGSFQISVTTDGLLQVINIVGLEDYLKGVLYNEVSQRWPLETIKAQAIVARTYALYQAHENVGKPYFLAADVGSQVYSGVYAHSYRTDKAVDDTAGEVIVYDDKLLPAFFHGCCGGRTEAADQLWKVKSPPLSGVSCAYCNKSPHYRWRYSIPLSHIEKKLISSGYAVSGIYSIEVGRRNASRRVAELKLKGSKRSSKISGKEFRQCLGASNIKSTNFNVEIRGRTAYFEGKGWGHGVGMCQWGAFAMAKKGKKSEDIIRYYYPGTEIIELDTNK